MKTIEKKEQLLELIKNFINKIEPHQTLCDDFINIMCRAGILTPQEKEKIIPNIIITQDEFDILKENAIKNQTYEIAYILRNIQNRLNNNKK